MIEFTAEGIPRPKGSLRPIRVGKKIRMIEQTDVKPWMAVIRAAAIPATTRTLDGPLGISARFTFPRPKSAKNRLYPHTRATGDVDKLLRAVFDALQPHGHWPGAIHDDSQVVKLRDVDAEYGPTPGVYVLVWELGVTDAPTPRQATLPGIVTP